MKRKILASTVMAFAMVMPVCGQQTKMLTAEKHNEYGLVYTLPKTAFEIVVTATHEVRKAGPYYQYAKKYVGTDNVITKDSETWTIDNVQMRSYGVPNNSERYLMQLKPGALTYIGVAADGMLLSVNRTPEEPAEWNPDIATRKEGEVMKDNEYLQYVGEDFIASQSSAKQAQLIAENLMEVRDAKISLTRGTADQMPTDGKQLELMLNSLSHQEAVLTAAFLGNVTKETVTRTYTFEPKDEGESVLFRMSDFAGFVSAEDYSGEPVYINVKVTNRGTLPVDAKGEEKKLPKDAVCYNVPGAAEISVSYMGKELYSKEYEVAQYGVVFGLNPILFTDRKEPSFAVFDPATGALREIGVMKEGNND